MTIILSAHNDGGVGKTTLAVHAAGVLSFQQSGRTLLVDCDDQADSWRFYVGSYPSGSKQLKIIDNISVISNKDRVSIKRVLNVDEYDNIVIDIDSPLKNQVQAIVQNDPDIILVPINLSQRIKALNNLPRTLAVISQLESKVGANTEAIVVPLGVERERVLQVVEKCDRKPQKCRVGPEMPNLQEEMQVAIYEDRKYIWDYDGYGYCYNYFCELLGI